MESPRDRHRARDWDEWSTGALHGRFLPLDVADVIQMAVTCAVEEAVTDREMLSRAAGEAVTTQRRQRYEIAALSAGMKRETLRKTSQGERWVTLPELIGLLSSPLMGARLREHIDRLFPLLNASFSTDQEPGRIPKAKSVTQRIGTASTTRLVAALAKMAEVEARVQADVKQLDWTQELARAQGQQVGSADWSAVRDAMSLDRARRTSPGGKNNRLRAAGVSNLTGLLRTLMVDSGEFPTYRAVGRVQKDHPLVSGKQVQDALTRLVKQGELRVVRRGLYEATEQMRRRAAS